MKPCLVFYNYFRTYQYMFLSTKCFVFYYTSKNYAKTLFLAVVSV